MPPQGGEIEKLIAAGAQRRFYALFAGEALWHERLALAVGLDAVTVVTPDGDVYDERYGDYEDMRVSGPRGGMAPKVRTAHHYDFDEDDLEADSEFMADANQEFQRHRQDAAAAAAAGGPAAGAGGGGGVPPGAVAGPVAGAGGGGAPLGAVGGGGAAPAGAAAPAAVAAPAPNGLAALGLGHLSTGSVWFLLEAVPGLGRVGDKLTILATDVGAGSADRALVCRRGSWIAVSKTEPPEVVAEDLRTMPVLYNPRGDRVRPLDSALQLVKEDEFDDFPVEGPRTTGWLLGAFAKAGQTPIMYHHWWRQVQGLSATEPGVDEHLFLAELLEHGYGYDQLNLGNLAWAETTSRRFQYWEERYAEKLRLATEGSALAGYTQERQLFLGGQRARGYALVSPELSRWISTRMAEESNVLKERRKGREERVLAAQAEAASRGSGSAMPAGAFQQRTSPAPLAGQQQAGQLVANPKGRARRNRKSTDNAAGSGGAPADH